MRFFHLSDLHLGKFMHHYNLREDQVHILREVAAYARKLHPDAILIAGDVYDRTAPSAEAVALFDEFLTDLSRIEPAIPVLIIAGNHDSGERLDYVREILDLHAIHIAGKPPASPKDYMKRVTLEDAWGPVHFYLLPFFKPSYVRGVFPGEGPGDYTETLRRLLEREEVDYEARNVLLTHQFYTGGGARTETCDSEMHSVGGLDNVDVSAAEGFDYVAMGHIHGPQQVGDPGNRYCGTLLKYSVSEEGHRKALHLVTLREKGSAPEIELLPLHPLRDVRKLTGRLEEILKSGREGGCEDYVSVVLTDEEELYKPREQLQSVYPHLLEVRLDNARTRGKLEMPEAAERKSPLEMYGDFYREVHGADMSGEARTLLERILEEMGELDV